MLSTDINITETTFIPASFNMYLVIKKRVTAIILSKFSRHYLSNRSIRIYVFLVILVYFNLKNILPMSGTFPPGHSVYCIKHGKFLDLLKTG